MGEEPQEEAAAAEGAAETPDHSSDLLETSTEYVAEEAYSFREEMETPKKPDNKQLSFFDMGMESGYEDNTGSGRDALLDADKVPEQTEALLEAKQIMQANEAHDRAILEDFDRRGLYGLNYHYSEEHHLYDGAPKRSSRTMWRLSGC